MTQFQKNIIKRCEKIKGFLGLNEYTLTIDFKDAWQGCAAATETNYKYLDIQITFYGLKKDILKEDLDLLIFHELCHTFSYKMNIELLNVLSKTKFKPIDEWNESMVERLSKLLYALYKKKN